MRFPRRFAIQRGMTLLEVLTVLAILGLIAAMVWPLYSRLDDVQRERITIERMDMIQAALLGPAQVQDSLDQDRIIGGYVGHLEEWPALWEPKPLAGSPAPTPAAPTGDWRGSFGTGERFLWNPELRRRTGAHPASAESLGQPRGLWAREVLSAADEVLTDGSTVRDEDMVERWRGPYLQAPLARRGNLARHFATQDGQYRGLDAVEREFFHLMQGAEQLVDGWERTFRFFISRDRDDPDYPASPDDEIFWIVSLGASGFGRFPTDMADYYNPTETNNHQHPDNRDNIVRQLRRSEWQAVLQAQRLRSRVTQRLIQLTEDRLERIVSALIGQAPAGPNSGYTGDLLAWPALYNRGYYCGSGTTPFEQGTPCCGDARATPTEIGNNQCASPPNPPPVPAVGPGAWSYFLDNPSTPYTYGQPRGLWRKDGVTDPARQTSKFGIGWRHGYHPTPADETHLRDEWQEPFHFFVMSNGDLLVLSAGPDRRFRVAASGGDLTHSTVATPGDPLGARTRSITAYDPDATENQDNRYRRIPRTDWETGFMHIGDLHIKGVTDAASCGTIRCRLYGVLSGPGGNPATSVRAGHWHEPDPTDPTRSYCRAGPADPAQPVFSFDNQTAERIVSGGRYLICWQDGVGGGTATEPGTIGWWRILATDATPARIAGGAYALDPASFETLP